MKFGIVLPHWSYNPQRLIWSEHSFASLARTNIEGLDTKPVLYIVLKHASGDDVAIPKVELPFTTTVLVRPSESMGPDSANSWGWYEICEREPDVTHLLMVTNDSVYNPDWLRQLEALVKRRPGARAWSVYRSRYVHHHKNLFEEGNDVSVRSINMLGCITKEEWLDWGLDWHVGSFHVPTPEGGCTMDLYHACSRPGMRWVTKRSYIENIATTGAHMTPDLPEFAVDFVGE